METIHDKIYPTKGQLNPLRFWFLVGIVQMLDNVSSAFFAVPCHNYHLINDLLLSSARSKSTAKGLQLHGYIVKSGLFLIPLIANNLINFYSKSQLPLDSLRAFDETQQKSATTWSSIISCFAQNELPWKSLDFLRKMMAGNLRPDDRVLPSATKSCAILSRSDVGRSVHCLSMKSGYESDSNFDSSSFVGSSLVSLYSKCGVLEGAYQAFRETPVKNLGIWNAMLKACAQHSHVQQVIELFKKMKRSGLKPNFITFLNVLNACSHAGLVDEGRYYFDIMKEEYRIEPTDKHYASLVDMLARAGKLQEALEVITNMPIDPTESVWGALLTGCTLHKNTELAAFAADKVFELGPVSSGMHISLSNAYAADGRFEDAAKARKLLRDRGEKKETGLSWVEERNRVHTFAAGERRHEMSKEIYEKLAELGEEMEKVGYVADTSFVLREVDGDEKNQTIRYHSERLAIAFGLITFPADRPIRVIKNLRVCGDCHNAIKFMSLR
ncbi:hypothetical protein HID58_038117 [Brassica napus]|uniref:DYW domain-containing protein n=1 Tax=Brassica napus TaxID=3708 RepID=A0ABQ8BN97_BRANA|nr:hypothetical protein HID58_038117 [Brassica napus]